MALLHDRGQHRVCFSPSRAECNAPLSGLGISGGPHSVCPGLRPSALLHFHRQPEKFCAWMCSDSCGNTCLLRVRPAKTCLASPRGDSALVTGYFGHFHIPLCTADTLRLELVRPRIKSTALPRALGLPSCELAYPHCRKRSGGPI